MAVYLSAWRGIARGRIALLMVAVVVHGSYDWLVFTSTNAVDLFFAALDAQNRSLLQDELVRIAQATRKTMVLITHSIDEAIKLSDRIIVMTKRPGTVKANLKIDIPRPRAEDDPQVIALKKQLRALIADEREVELA